MNYFLKQLRPTWVIARREVTDHFRDWRVIFPIIGLTLFFPFIMNFTARQILGFVEKYGANIIAERMVPFLLMIVGFFPISVSLVIALESFVGEKERGSIEPLLNTPLQDWQLYLGKLLSATIPPLIASYLGMGVYLAGLYYKNIPLPETDILVLIIILTTVQAVMMVSGAVVVSTQATSIRSANLLASFIIIPSAFLIQGESIVMFWGHSYHMLWWAVVGLAILTILLIRVGLAHFNREELLGREIDVLNIRWILKTFRNYFINSATSPWNWYRTVLPHSINRLKIPLVITAILAIAGAVLGTQQVSSFFVPLQVDNVAEMNTRVSALLETMPLFATNPVFVIWWQNIRVMLIAMLLGAFSLGILGMMPLMLSMGMVGYLLGLLSQNGFPIHYYLFFIIPHGIIEIPAAILATASVLHSGATIASPIHNRPVGEVWLESLARWAQIMLGAVIPMLLIAAGIEAWITPRIVLWLFR
jgi:uncharacterized membrane protein SpoIIM required for sporulation/ABC-type transport system involved in multi-copper enzyme maturation permease subunit